MLAQRASEAVIDAIEIEENACRQAVENIDNSLWKSRITVTHTSLQAFETSRKYDLIVSNPPYFSDSLKNPDSLKKIALTHPDVDIVYPVHLNPNVQKPVFELLSDVKNILLISPLDYLPFIYLMQHSYLILTDSGGIQEEAPSLGKPVLVMRETTERPEAVDAGTVKMVGTDVNKIISFIIDRLLSLYVSSN